MISDDDLYRLAIFLGSAAMLLIILYHFLEINAVEEPEGRVGRKVIMLLRDGHGVADALGGLGGLGAKKNTLELELERENCAVRTTRLSTETTRRWELTLDRCVGFMDGIAPQTACMTKESVHLRAHPTSTAATFLPPAQVAFLQHSLIQVKGISRYSATTPELASLPFPSIARDPPSTCSRSIFDLFLLILTVRS
ncbi:hypothetical protein VTL71DRAFT_15158 [Oculimacula yallundae]|uniref:Dolichyl-diphosphooligosaccharide--protein glycosyltransferase subunit 4 n=1 Tax=Oculimacula yallundae TaxID=86028 RepID=A0ABR4CFS9_9HELO